MSTSKVVGKPEMVPRWGPLERILSGPEKCGDWMFMASHRIESGEWVHTYKHGMSRKYLNISDDDRTWEFDAGNNGYTEIPRQTALERAYGSHAC